MFNLSYLTLYVVGGSIAMMAAVLIGFGAALKKSGWPATEQSSAMRTVAGVLIGWFAVAATLSWNGVFEGALGRAPTIQYGLFIPIILGIVMMWRSAFVARIIDIVPQQWIIAVQLYRALGVVFLVQYAMGHMPGLFAFPAGIGDVAVGLLAPVVASRYARNPQAHAAEVRTWNLLGIADLAIAVGTGFLTSPSALQMYAFDNPNTLISAFPLVLVPVYLVPLSIVLHIASLKKLRQMTARGATTPA